MKIPVLIEYKIKQGTCFVDARFEAKDIYGYDLYLEEYKKIKGIK